MPLPGGPIIKQVVAAGRGHDERALGEGLAAHVRKIGARAPLDGIVSRRDARQPLAAGQVLHDFVQVPRNVDFRVGDERRLGCVGGGQHNRVTRLLCPEHRRQRAVDGPQIAVQRELAEKLRVGDGPGSVLLRQQHAERDREIEASARFRDVGRSQMDGDAARRNLVA